MQSIQVKSGYEYPEAITVQIRTADGDLDECNHAGAESEALEFTVYSSYDGGAYQAPDDSRTEYCMVCDKCEAWYDELNEEWKEQ